MPWTAPKTDWAVTDVFAHTDANRIEENIDYLNDAFDDYKKYDVERRDVHLSGFAASAITIDKEAEKILQQVTVNVPDTGSLNLLLVRCAGFDPFVQIRVRVDGADPSEIYTGPSGAFDTTEYPSGGSVKLLYQNNTGSTVAKTLSISAYNLSSVIFKEIAAGGGWEIKCGITLPTDY